ncbi:hypothetical protein DL96DRAFT_1720080 [Flagelloscypha sp. PMI_526]|nr:hypothetical protein DL96DRAFT_1720080 [Flagelloscypha sp. PMI_526]
MAASSSSIPVPVSMPWHIEALTSSLGPYHHHIPQPILPTQTPNSDLSGLLQESPQHPFPFNPSLPLSTVRSSSSMASSSPATNFLSNSSTSREALTNSATFKALLSATQAFHTTTAESFEEVLTTKGFRPFSSGQPVSTYSAPIPYKSLPPPHPAPESVPKVPIDYGKLQKERYQDLLSTAPPLSERGKLAPVRYKKGLGKVLLPEGCVPMSSRKRKLMELHLTGHAEGDDGDEMNTDGDERGTKRRNQRRKCKKSRRLPLPSPEKPKKKPSKIRKGSFLVDEDLEERFHNWPDHEWPWSARTAEHDRLINKHAQARTEILERFVKWLQEKDEDDEEELPVRYKDKGYYEEEDVYDAKLQEMENTARIAIPRDPYTVC